MKPDPKSAAPPKPKQPEASLGEILSGVDIIGTMLHLDLPKLEKEILEIKSLVTPTPATERRQSASLETAQALEELKELVQLMAERLSSLERRLAHVTALCESWNASREES